MRFSFVRTDQWIMRETYQGTTLTHYERHLPIDGLPHALQMAMVRSLNEAYQTGVQHAQA